MKKSILLLSVFIVLLVVLQLFLTWWSLVIPCFLIGFLLPYTPARSFWLSFGIVFLLWISASLLLDLSSNGKISERMALVFFMPNKYLLFLVAGIIGGIAGGFSTLAGAHFKKYRNAEQTSQS